MSDDQPRDFYRPLPYIDIRRVNDAHVERESAIRLYCATVCSTWLLQVRALITLGNGQQGKDFIVASASLSVDDLRALRDAINAELCGEAPPRKEGAIDRDSRADLGQANGGQCPRRLRVRAADIKVGDRIEAIYADGTRWVKVESLSRSGKNQIYVWSGGPTPQAYPKTRWVEVERCQ